MRSTQLARLAVALCVFLGLASVFPEQAWHWDEFQLAYAVGDFDLARHQPHPPGYYLFVLAGRALDGLLGDPFLALRCVSALAVAAFAAMAISVPAPGGTRIAHAGFIAAAAAFALASPFTQRFGVAALSYAAEGAIWLAWLLALGKRRGSGGLLGLAFAAGLAGGARQTLLLWAAVMLAFEVVRRREWRKIFAIVAAGSAGIACWLAPLLREAGGWAAYRADVGAIATGNVWAKSVFATGLGQWDARLAAMGLDLLTSLGGVGIVLAAALVLRARGAAARDPANDTLLAGAAIAFSFYALVIYDSPGYLSAVVLPLVAWSLRSISAAAATWRRPRQLAAASVVLVLALGTAVTPRERIDVHYAAHASLLDARLSPLRARFDPRTTVLVTSREYFDYGLRHVAHALPEFAVLQLARDPYFSIVDDAHPYLVAKDRQLEAAGPDPLDLASLSPGGRLSHVIYTVPFDANDFVAAACGPLSEALDTAGAEKLVAISVAPGWRIEARRQRLHCVAADAR